MDNKWAVTKTRKTDWADWNEKRSRNGMKSEKTLKKVRKTRKRNKNRFFYGNGMESWNRSMERKIKKTRNGLIKNNILSQNKNNILTYFYRKRSQEKYWRVGHFAYK